MKLIPLLIKTLKSKFKLFTFILAIVILTTSMITSVFLVSDYLTYATAKETYSTLPVDIVTIIDFRSPPPPLSDYVNIYRVLMKKEYIIDAHFLYHSILFRVDMIDYTNGKIFRWEEADVSAIILGINFSDPFWREQVELLNDSTYPLENYEIIIDREFADFGNVSRGHIINFLSLDYDTTLPFNLTVTGKYVPGDFLLRHINDFAREAGYYGIFICNIETATKILEKLFTPYIYSFYYYIWVDRDLLINPWDEYTTLNRLSNLTSEILLTISSARVISSFSIRITNLLHIRMMEYYATVRKYRSQISFIVVLVIIFVAITNLISGELTSETRRREIGLLKIRGGNIRTLYLVFLMEWILLGILGGLFGFLLSPVTASVMVFAVSSYYASKYSIIEPFLRVFSSYFYTSIIFAIALSLFTVILPARRAAKLEPLEAIQDYVESEELTASTIDIRPAVVLLLIGGYFLVDFLLNMRIMNSLVKFAYNVGYSVLIDVVDILYFIEITIMPFLSPFLIAVGAIAIVVGLSDKLAKVFELIIKPFLKETTVTAVKNLSRRPTRTILVLFILAFTIISNITMGGGIATAKSHMITEARLAIGADIKVTIYSVRDLASLNRTIISTIYSINGVDIVIRSYIKHVEIYMLGLWQKITVIGIDPIYFTSPSFKNEYLVITKNASRIAELLKENYSIINMGAVKRNMLPINATISVGRVPGRRLSLIQYKLIDYYFFLPGIFSDIFTPQIDESMYLVVGFDTFWNAFARIYFHLVPEELILLIHVSKGADPEAIAKKIQEKMNFYQLKGSVQVLENVIFNILNKEYSSALLSLYETSLLFSSTLVVLVVFIVITISIYERRRELALLRVRGFRKNLIAKLLIGEGLLAIIIALTISIPVSVLMVISWIGGSTKILPFIDIYLKTYSGIYYPPEWVLFVIPPYQIVYLTVILSSVILSYTIPFLILTRKPMPEEVRIHH
ncbi:MAG: FtsX-like permease family protein [Candidatus Njordarchaeales archaeon]